GVPLGVMTSSGDSGAAGFSPPGAGGCFPVPGAGAAGARFAGLAAGFPVSAGGSVPARPTCAVCSVAESAQADFASTDRVFNPGLAGSPGLVWSVPAAERAPASRARDSASGAGEYFFKG